MKVLERINQVTVGLCCLHYLNLSLWTCYTSIFPLKKHGIILAIAMPTAEGQRLFHTSQLEMCFCSELTAGACSPCLIRAELHLVNYCGIDQNVKVDAVIKKAEVLSF